MYKKGFLSLLGHLNFAKCIIPHGHFLFQVVQSQTSVFLVLDVSLSCVSGLSFSMLGVVFRYDDDLFGSLVSLHLFSVAVPPLVLGGIL